MFSALLPMNEQLRTGSRFRPWLAAGEGEVSLRELAFLVAMGAAAAVASTMLDLGLRVPGHAIVRTVLPLGLGLALAPRSGAGVLMSGSAGLTLAALRGAGVAGGGVGALTSL